MSNVNVMIERYLRHAAENPQCVWLTNSNYRPLLLHIVINVWRWKVDVAFVISCFVSDGVIHEIHALYDQIARNIHQMLSSIFLLRLIW